MQTKHRSARRIGCGCKSVGRGCDQGAGVQSSSEIMKYHKRLIRISEANHVLASAETKVIRHMLQYAYTTLLMQNQTPNTDDSNEPFDAAFYLKLIKHMVSHERYIKKLIDGELDESEWGIS